ncbi:MAG: ISKra4 family transposase, partial [Nocardioidaceae bacterium]
AADVPLVLDLLHVLEKLWKAAYVFHSETSPEAAAFVRDRARRILTGNSPQVVKGLRQMATKHHLTGARAKTLHSVANYYHANRNRMHYHHYLANGWPIASGSVEGACKNLIRDRFERSGMRWTPTMAEAMLKMRAVHLSGDLDAYWQWHIHQDQQRLHPNGAWKVDAK